MSIKMVLIPVERLKAYEKKTTETPNLPPDIELKMLRQREARKMKRSTTSRQHPVSLEKNN